MTDNTPGSTTTNFLLWEATSLDTIDVKRVYIDVAGDLVAGILLSQILFWYLPKKDGSSKLTISKDGKEWVAKRREDWWDECRISPKQFDRASALLEKLQIITMHVFRFNGSPIVHIYLNLEILQERVKSILTKGEDRSSPKVNIHVDQRERLLRPETTAETTYKDKKKESPISPYGDGSVSGFFTQEISALETTTQTDPSPDPLPPNGVTPQPKSSKSRKSLKDVTADAQKVLDTLNTLTNRCLTTTGEIPKRLRDGRTVEECCLVLEWMCHSEESHAKFLRDKHLINQKTPFRRDNFDDYCDQATAWKNTQTAPNGTTEARQSQINRIRAEIARSQGVRNGFNPQR